MLSSIELGRIENQTWWTCELGHFADYFGSTYRTRDLFGALSVSGWKTQVFRIHHTPQVFFTTPTWSEKCSEMVAFFSKLAGMAVIIYPRKKKSHRHDTKTSTMRLMDGTKAFFLFIFFFLLWTRREKNFFKVTFREGNGDHVVQSRFCKWVA